MNGFRRLLHHYGQASARNPNLTAALSAGAVFFSSDCCAQYVTSRKNPNATWDVRRTGALTSFGFLYYGGLCARMYKVYDLVLGPRRFLAKAFFDVFIHTPFILLPSFYFWTSLFENRLHVQIQKC